ncbi:MAG: UDP-N-acetylmuramate dehydrogenase [Candidatus Pacebacteria bacterium]|nr:UDP-N-acetylmuramate dehydrogenase [Candidatus Paceibacterota bacterium]
MEIKRNVSLKNYTTFRIGGKARYFSAVKDEDDLIESLKFSERKKIPFFILGLGSNVLVSDEGFKGLIIKIQNSKFKIQNSTIITDAGVLLGKLVNLALKNNLTGLEWAAGIPGTVGGAIRGNSGAFNESIGNAIKEAKVLNVKLKKIENLNSKECRFKYRESVFKENKNLIILSATLNLKKGNKIKIQNKINKNLETRKSRQPLEFPSAGSIFLNPPDFSAAELIEKCNLKGRIMGGAKISEKHANFIINIGSAKSSDVKKLINLIKKEVKAKFKINLKEEIEYLE